MRRNGRAVAGMIAAIFALPSVGRAQAAYEQLQTFSSLLSQIRLNYVDTVSTAQLVHGAIRGMLATLDPHSYFQSASDASRMAAWRAGELAGTGIWLEDVDGAVTVEAVLAGTPAADAHISPGDRVVALNDTAVAGVAATDVQARMIGDRGTRLTLRLERGSRLEPETYQQVAGEDLGNFMAHVQLAQLYEEGGEWSQALAERRLAIQIDPDDPTMVRDLGVTLLRAHRAAEADSVLAAESAANPRDWNALYHLGLARETLGRYPGAVAAYDAFVREAPSRLVAAIGDARQRADALRRKLPAN